MFFFVAAELCIDLFLLARSEFDREIVLSAFSLFSLK